LPTRAAENEAAERDGMRSSILYIVYGVLAALVIVLIAEIQNERPKTTGIAIAFSKNGLTIQERN
jgi:hypothetical protein